MTSSNRIPGEKTVTAILCNSDASAGAKIVDVNKILINEMGGWNDVTGANIVLSKGTTYTFKALPNPEDAPWPSGAPIWTGYGDTEIGDTIEVTFYSAGTRTINVICCSDTGTCIYHTNPGKTVTIDVVEVDRVVKSGTNNEGPLYSCLYDTVYLEAKPYPATAPFPEGEPTWSIQSCPPGGSASLSLSSGPIVALYGFTKIGDYIVKASCGTGDMGDTITVTAYTIKSQTVSLVPANRERTLLGIGEQVICYTEPSVPVKWIAAGGGSVAPRTGTSTKFTALKIPTYPSVYATPITGGCSLSLDFTVIAPTGENNRLFCDVWSIGTKGPPNNYIGHAHYFEMTILPTSVSFYWAKFREDIPGETWTWPDGTVGSLEPDICEFEVDYDNTMGDKCFCYFFPINRIYNGSSYVDFTISIDVPEDYQNEWGYWISFLPNGLHDCEFEGTDQTSRRVIHDTNVAYGTPMGPWQ